MAGSVIGAIASLAHRLPIKVLKRVFAGLLLVLSAKMLCSLYGT